MTNILQRIEKTLDTGEAFENSVVSARSGQEQAVLMSEWWSGEVCDVFMVADSLLTMMDDLYVCCN